MNNISNKNKIYLYAFFLFIIAFRFTDSLISSYKSANYDYLTLISSAVLILFAIMQIVHFSKNPNDKSNKQP